MIYIYSDILYASGGIETYLHALALHLKRTHIPVRVVVTELETCTLLDDLVVADIPVYRQRRVKGDRWLLRQRIMMAWLFVHLRKGDWVFCVRQPEQSLYFDLVRLVHLRGAKIAASWMLAPEFLPPTARGFTRAIAQTDCVISVSECTVSQFRSIYGYGGPVFVVRYHNIPLFDHTVPLPKGPPWKVGYIGRIENKQKNLADLIVAAAQLAREGIELELHLHGRGPDRSNLMESAERLGIYRRVWFHGPYDHRRDLERIVSGCHFFVYPSRFEGGPCFSLLELMQAGRYCVASRVGGIPDLYEGRPDIGALVTPGDIDSLVAGLKEAIRLTASGLINQERIRARLFEGGFDMEGAHRSWEAALQIDATSRQATGCR